ncbi:TetR/AcrR family transcriptional regulator [Nocardia sp. CA-128927]|uniref:TetR/AcrR family transcriptional regulator n=1 Tax=Nocardia sp. CA-128927 TaxID=3239975 RepID=UPI003D967E00
MAAEVSACPEIEAFTSPSYRTMHYYCVTLFYIIVGQAVNQGKAVKITAQNPNRGDPTVMADRARTPSKDVERALVEAAEAVLIRDGLAGVTVRAVAAEARVAPMGVYNRFSGKHGLERELLIRGFQNLRTEVGAPADADPLTRLRNASIGYRRFAIEHPQHYMMMFHQTSASEHFANEAVQDTANGAFSELVANVRYAIARGAIAEGDPVALAQHVWSALHGAVSLELDGAMRVADPAASYAELVELLIRGLRTGL